MTGATQPGGVALKMEYGRGSEEWIPVSPTFPISLSIMSGLKCCTWPGRNQIIKEGFVHYFLDGAHTNESIWLCAEWFIQNSRAIGRK